MNATVKRVNAQNKKDHGTGIKGRTFEVSEVVDGKIYLVVDGITTEFGLTEVEILDFETEFQDAYNIENSEGSKGLYSALRKYAQANEITVETTFETIP